MEFMNWVDIALLLILLLFGLFGFLTGFTEKFFSTLSWIGAGILSMHVYPWLKPWAKYHISNDTIATIVTFVAVFIALLIVFKVATRTLATSIRGGPLGSLDRGLGVVLGLLTGFVVLSSLYLFDINYLGFFYKKEGFHRSRVWSAAGVGAYHLGAILPDHILKTKPKKKSDDFVESLSQIKIRKRPSAGYRSSDRSQLSKIEASVR